MRELPEVTLCCVDTAYHALSLRALEASRRDLRFGRTLLLTDALPAGVVLPAGIEIAAIGPLASRADYSQFVLKSLAPYVETTHVLLIQWDGYVVNPDGWDPAFLDCDYLGAKWFWHADGMRVGNGGFSLRSRRLLQALADPAIALVDVEDETICRHFRPLLERDHGIRFGSEALADRFSFEVSPPVGRPFGFHGLFNFCRTVAPAELAALAPGFPDAIARAPQLLALLRNCMALGQWQPAAAIGRRIVAADPTQPEAAGLLAAAERNLAQPPAVGRNEPCPCGSGRKYKQCHGALGAAATVPAAPPDAGALARAGMTLHQQGDLAAAEARYQAALALEPSQPLALHYLGVVRYQQGALDAALPLLEAAVAAVPAEPEFHNNLGLALTAADRADAAIAAYRAALALRSDHVGAWNNLGLALQAGNRVGEAIAAFREAVARAPQFAQAQWNLALALLLDRRFDEGWRHYEARLAVPQFQPMQRSHRLPRWDGVVRPGVRLVLVTEQGLGDALQFIRFAAPLADAGVTVLVSTQAPLRRLLATAPGVTAVFGPDDPPPAADAELPLLSLPGVLKIGDDVPPAPYLTADADRPLARALLPADGRPRIGLAWAGSALHSNDRRRSMRLADLAPLLRGESVHWQSLQKGDAATAIEALGLAASIRALPADADFDDVAALVAGLDLVISVDTSIAHLAGALGTPVWILLPFAPDWRWGVTGDTTPWYGQARLFRQPGAGDWAAVVASVGAALARFRPARSG